MDVTMERRIKTEKKMQKNLTLRLNTSNLIFCWGFIVVAGVYDFGSVVDFASVFQVGNVVDLARVVDVASVVDVVSVIDVVSVVDVASVYVDVNVACFDIYVDVDDVVVKNNTSGTNDFLTNFVVSRFLLNSSVILYLFIIMIDFWEFNFSTEKLEKKFESEIHRMTSYQKLWQNFLSFSPSAFIGHLFSLQKINLS